MLNVSRGEQIWQAIVDSSNTGVTTGLVVGMADEEEEVPAGAKNWEAEVGECRKKVPPSQLKQSPFLQQL